MAEPRTLYLRNLPARPASKDHFIRELLRCVNSSNRYACNIRLPLPQTDLHTSYHDRELLDEENGIVAISISRKLKLRNQCFMTFIDPVSASRFKDKFESSLVVRGRHPDIRYATKDSLMALALRNSRALQKALSSRKICRKRRNDPEFAQALRLKRKLRRIRSKLRRKNVDEDKISSIIQETIAQETDKSQQKHQSTKGTIPVSKSSKKDVPETRTNPANKILLVQNIPQDTTKQEIESYFHNDGLVEVRLVAVRNLAFVEYSNIESAKNIIESFGSTHHWKGADLSIWYAK